jgi:hypothetical protein
MITSLYYKISRGSAIVLLFSCLFIILTFILIHATPKAAFPRPTSAESIAFDALIVSSIAAFVSAIGTASTVLLGWRADRRQSEELKLKVRDLELKLEEARAKEIKIGSAN